MLTSLINRFISHESTVIHLTAVREAAEARLRLRTAEFDREKPEWGKERRRGGDKEMQEEHGKLSEAVAQAKTALTSEARPPPHSARG